ncbi:MAG: sulfite exporter TauE/SafE family protein [Actinomycetota bacterium]|nr:sulfite exporter TauE/SafE family protein [Actinomycetota bacterium]
MKIVFAIPIGFAAGMLAGMFGLGGALITTPGLRILLATSPAIALGTPLPVTIPTSLIGAATYLRRGYVDFKLASLGSLGGIAGSCCGAFLTKIINLHYLMIVTGIILIYVAIVTMYRQKAQKLEGTGAKMVGENSHKTPISPQGVVGIGALAGFISGLLGIGGGIILTPAFIHLAKMPIRKSIATSIAIITAIAIPGTIIHHFLGHISWSLFAGLAAGSIPAAYLGARLNIKTREKTIAFLFGALLLVFGVVFVIKEVVSILG